MGVVVRRYIDFLILLIPTPLVSVLFYSSIPTFCSFFYFMFFVLYIYPSLSTTVYFCQSPLEEGEAGEGLSTAAGLQAGCAATSRGVYDRVGACCHYSRDTPNVPSRLEISTVISSLEISTVIPSLEISTVIPSLEISTVIPSLEISTVISSLEISTVRPLRYP